MVHELIAGYPYVLPLLFAGDTWEVDKRFGDTSFLKNEMKRMNKAAKEHYTKVSLLNIYLVVAMCDSLSYNLNILLAQLPK